MGSKEKEEDSEEKKKEQADSDAKEIADIKQYLHEMSNMEPDDYKAVMRRLFKMWHPDKAENQELANKIFHLLRAHEQWYKKRQKGETDEDDSWLDADDAAMKKESKDKDGNDNEPLAIEDAEKKEDDD